MLGFTIGNPKYLEGLEGPMVLVIMILLPLDLMVV